MFCTDELFILIYFYIYPYFSILNKKPQQEIEILYEILRAKALKMTVSELFIAMTPWGLFIAMTPWGVIYCNDRVS
jgi:aromatic ring-opening dioxygenase LigB subunit